MLRIASAAVLVAVLLSAIWVLPFWATGVLVVIAAALAGGELAVISAHAGATLPAFFVAVASSIVAVAFLISAGGLGDAGVLAGVLAALLLAGGTLTLAFAPPEPQTLARAAMTVFAPLYIGVPLGAIAWVQLSAGPAATTWLVMVIAVSDSAQYYTGRAFGRRKLAPAVSPAKTIEGAIGGVAIGLVAGAMLSPLWLPSTPMWRAAVLALMLVLFGIAGDLFESLLKRSAGVKDSSHLIPGHGGVLDRIDSYLFAAPIYFLFLRYVG